MNTLNFMQGAASHLVFLWMPEGFNFVNIGL